MTKIWRRGLLTGLFWGVLLELVPACGMTSGSGEAGSESHWLASCRATADCAVGECLCGMCTESCRVAQDCPAPLDVCAIPDEASDQACRVAICRSTSSGEIAASLEADERISTCDDGRPSALVLVKHRPGAEKAFADGERGFLLFGTASAFEGAVRVNVAGRVMGSQASVSDLNPELSEITTLPDGSALLCGSVQDFDGQHGWVAKIDPNWQLSWELELEQPAVLRENIVALPDGGAVMATFEQEGWPDSKTFDVTLTRMSAEGSISWQRRATFDGGVDGTWDSQRAVALTDNLELRILLPTDGGVRMIFGTLDGASEVHELDLDLVGVSHIAALPNGGVALLGSKLVALDANGDLLWQRAYPQEQTRARAMIFNTARRELLLVGQTPASGSWLWAADANGQPKWHLERAPQPDGDEDFALVRGRGPILLDVAAAADGSVIAPGFSNERLVYFTVGAGSCD